MQTYTQQPDETLDYTVDFGPWLAPGDTLASATATADTGLTVQQVTHTNTTVTLWLSGGTDGNTYQARVQVTTASNPARVKDADFKVKIKQQ